MSRAHFLAGIVLVATPVRAETLQDAITAAYGSNPVLAAARARREALGETIEQARAEGRLSASTEVSAGYDRLDYGRGARATIGASLPIWTGGRVATAVHAARAEVSAADDDLRDTEAAVLQNVVGAYADLMYFQQAVEVSRVALERLDRQAAETQSRYDLGDATGTDVAQLLAQRASVAATLVDTEGALAGVAATYAMLVGHEAVRLAPAPSTLANLPGSLADARKTADTENPLIGARRDVAEASHARIAQARAQAAPTLSIEGLYGYSRSLEEADRRGYASAAAGGLTFRLPLLTGGLIASRVRQAESVLRADQYEVEVAVREAVRSTDASWATSVAASRRLKANAEEVAAAERALKGVQAEYALNLRSTLDILLADQSLRAAQLSLARSTADALIAQAALLRAIGRLSRSAFGNG